MTDNFNERLLRDLAAIGRLERDRVPASVRLEAAIGPHLLAVVRRAVAPQDRATPRSSRVA